LAQIIVGVMFVGLGIALTLIGMRLFSIAIIVIVPFFAHAGVIFWFKRLRKRIAQL
jgi:hypothetical protein